jgi:hypothetical protein
MSAGTAVRPRRSDINFICCPFPASRNRAGGARPPRCLLTMYSLPAASLPSIRHEDERQAVSRSGQGWAGDGGQGPAGDFRYRPSARHEAGCDPATCWPDYSGREPEPGGVPESTCSTSAAAPARPSAMPPGRQAETGAGRGPLGADARAGPVARRQAGHRQRQLRAGRRADLPLPRRIVRRGDFAYRRSVPLGYQGLGSGGLRRASPELPGRG